jgi:hypothetical protein
MQTAVQALILKRAEQGLDPAYDTAATWPFTIGPVTIPMPNFSWRRAAIQRHDLHHILTGYPFTMRGEFQVATWEFAAGRYPHWGATLLLLPLVVLGLFWSPTAIWCAFRRGRGELSLFRPELRDAAARLSLDALAERTRMHVRRHQAVNVIAFAWLVLQSGTLIVAPIVALIIVVGA